MNLIDHRCIFNKMMASLRQINIRYICFFIKKEHIHDVVETTANLSKQISQFVHDNFEDFLSYYDVKLYYDNGQVEVCKILSSVFNVLLPNPTFRRVMPTEYMLFQADGFLCTLN